MDARARLRRLPRVLRPDERPSPRASGSRRRRATSSIHGYHLNRLYVPCGQPARHDRAQPGDHPGSGAAGVLQLGPGRAVPRPARQLHRSTNSTASARITKWATTAVSPASWTSTLAPSSMSSSASVSARRATVHASGSHSDGGEIRGARRSSSSGTHVHRHAVIDAQPEQQPLASSPKVTQGPSSPTTPGPRATVEFDPSTGVVHANRTLLLDHRVARPTCAKASCRSPRRGASSVVPARITSVATTPSCSCPNACSCRMRAGTGLRAGRKQQTRSLCPRGGLLPPRPRARGQTWFRRAVLRPGAARVPPRDAAEFLQPGHSGYLVSLNGAFASAHHPGACSVRRIPSIRGPAVRLCCPPSASARDVDRLPALIRCWPPAPHLVRVGTKPVPSVQTRFWRPTTPTALHVVAALSGLST